MLTDREEKKLRAELKKERTGRKRDKKVIKHLRGKIKATEHTFEAMQLRKTGKTWKKIGKKLEVPESSIRLATQKRYKQRYLRGRWSEAKLSTSELIDSRTMKLIEAQEGAQRGMNYEEYVRTTRS